MRTTHYFVDEAGDSSLFSKKGKTIIGQPGNSRFFIMGLLDVGDPGSLMVEMETLRSDLIADLYFKDVPSMLPKNRKTAISFHAKDDLPEVRHQVFRLLRARDDLRFFGIVAEKFSTLDYVKNRQLREPEYRYHQDEIYDFLVRRLFRDRLHSGDTYEVVFAKRGNRKRKQILQEQLELAQQRHLEKFQGGTQAKIQVASGIPSRHAGLQAVDYYLWALQRLYERGEDRYLVNIWEDCKLVIDIHDTRNHAYGEYYYKRKPLTSEKLLGRIKG